MGNEMNCTEPLGRDVQRGTSALLPCDQQELFQHANNESTRTYTSNF